MDQHNPDSHSSGDPLLKRRDTARFFVENRQIAWVLLIATLVWGVFAYIQMPQRKDPEVPVHLAVAICPWPGSRPDRVEELVTRRMEEAIAQNPRVRKIESISHTSAALVYVDLDEAVKDPGKEFDDIRLKLDAIHNLPQGAGPIQFLKDFGETAALMLTVASPPPDASELGFRARQVRQAIEQVRSHASPGPRVAGVVGYPLGVNPVFPRRMRDQFVQFARDRRAGRDIRPIEGPGFVGVDGNFGDFEPQLAGFVNRFLEQETRPSERHPEVWPIAIIRDPSETEQRLTEVASDKYRFRELDQFTEVIQRTLQALPLVSKVTRSGVLTERIFLEFSQERLAQYGIQPSAVKQILEARNITLPGGILEVAGTGLRIDPSGQFKNEREIGDVIVASSASGTPVYLRDAVDILRGYESPPKYLNFYVWRDGQGAWHRNRAVTLSIQMRSGQQIGEFGTAVDAALADLKLRLPSDLILARTSDQPRQVEESIDLLMQSLLEAVGLVVLVALIGFWEWRSAVLMAVSIPLTLAMTFGMMHLLGVDMQQVSIASLIIALGLLVDDPVVAGDAIKRELASGFSRVNAAWLGPARLATAILFATVTNIVAYLPILLLGGDLGRFVYSLPVVLGCSLVASRIVSMTFVPLLGYYLLRPSAKPVTSIEERRKRGFGGFYYRIGGWALEHRWAVLAASVVFLSAGGYFLSNLKQQFFPKDLSYLSYVDVWLPENATFASTSEAVSRAERLIRETAREYSDQHPAQDGKPAEVLQSITSFIGGGGPRFWFSVSPELQQVNYAQLIIQMKDKHDTAPFVAPLQNKLSAMIPGARLDVRQLETGKPVGVPVAVRISGESPAKLRELADQAKQIFRSISTAERIRDDWGAESFVVKLSVDPDRANLAGISNSDVALSSSGGINGFRLTQVQQGEDEVAVISRLRTSERSQISDVQDLYVYSMRDTQKIPLREISSIGYTMETEKVRRRNQFPTITVSCFPAEGVLPSEVMAAARAPLQAFTAGLPPGYKLEIGGEEEEQVKGFAQMQGVMGVSVLLIFLALVLQFKSAVKPFIVFAAIPFGMVGALAALALMHAPFGFMAFLGVASLIGVIVSHVIVLFDFIEEAHHQGMPLREALLDAAMVRLRPVLITVGATVFGLVPLAVHGGPLWEPLCYAQIGGLTAATFITLLLVPVIYAVAVLDLKIIRWDKAGAAL